tara:strand:+ start:261 stop:410 length:150 start_codon:yes stop_codon:yes gene_type:complete
MIYLKIILDAIKENLIIIGVGLLGILSMIGMFLPKNSKMKKFLNFLTKK